MARLITVPGLASLLLVSRAAEIDDLIDHPALDRAFVPAGPFVNRLLVGSIHRQTRHGGEVLEAFRPRADAHRAASQRRLFELLDRFAGAGSWPPAPVGELARYVIEGRDRRNAEAALAFAIAWPFLGNQSSVPQDDAYRPVGRHLWRLHRLTARARRPLSLSGLAFRLAGVDRRARAAILERTGGEPYGLHAVEITLANARVILEQMRRIMADRDGEARLAAGTLAWAAIRTAPEVVVRQSGESFVTLPWVESRVPPHTLVLLRMRSALEPASPSGFEFASRHWSACPARRYVMGLFTAVAETAIAMARARARS